MTFVHSRAMWLSIVVGGAAAVLVSMGACSSISDNGTPSDQDSSVTTDSGVGDDTHVATDTGSADSGTGETSTDAGACPGATDAAGLDPDAVSQGHDLVHSYGCPRCHQSTPEDAGIVLSGQTTSIIDGGAIYPKNLTPDQSTGLGCWTDTQIKTAILTGVDDEGKPLCVMPKFGAAGLDDAKAQLIVDFLRSLPAVNHVIPESTCPPPGGDAGADTHD